MMTRRGLAGSVEPLDQVDAAAVAASLQKDFTGLIAILDRKLANGTGADHSISDAREAAERGLRLSQELIELLRTVL